VFVSVLGLVAPLYLRHVQNEGLFRCLRLIRLGCRIRWFRIRFGRSRNSGRRSSVVLVVFGLAVGDASPVRKVEGVLPVRAGFRVQGDEPFVDERDLDGLGLEDSVLHAAPVVVVEIHGHELGHEGTENVEHAPLLLVDGVKVKLAGDLVDVVKELDGEDLESGELSAFAVYFEEDVLFEEAFALDHVFKGVEGAVGGFFCDFADADVVEVVVASVGPATRLGGVRAVVLIVGHLLHSGHLAAEVVVTVYPHVDDSLARTDEVLADHVTAVGRNLVSVARKLAVGVLSDGRATL
jgi:hypothetical protein